MKYKIQVPFLFFIFITTYTSVQCQIIVDTLKSKEDYIINTTVYKKGIYRSFIEFKYNNPSITEEFFFRENKLWSKKGKKKLVYKKEEYWGFCDGEKIYVQWDNKNWELLEKGRYCFFEVIEKYFSTPYDPNIAFSVTTYQEDKDALIINFNNGMVFKLTKKLFRDILEIDDPELLEEFNQETWKRSKLFDYIVKYNQRNTDKIK